MKVHNLLEEVVFEKVNKTYEQLKSAKTPWLTCDCHQCRSDVAALVLNQLPPKYVVSGRGVTYNNSSDNTQTLVDIDTRIIDAIKVVSSVQRPYHNLKEPIVNDSIKGPVFNFPTLLPPREIYTYSLNQSFKDANHLFQKSDTETAAQG